MVKKKTANKKATSSDTSTVVAAPTKKATKKAASKKKTVTTATPKKKAVKKSAAKKSVKKKVAVKKSVKKKVASKTSAKKKAVPKKKTAATKTTATKTAATKATTTANVIQSATTTTSTSTNSKPTKNTPVELGKLAKKYYPEHSNADEFECFGPPATKDGEFDTVRICDMGCFTQDGKDSNKYYHGAVVRHKDSHNWYAYFEWGRTGASNPTFQFIGCNSEQQAVSEFAKQLHSKNDKRGEWVTIAGIQTLQAKKGKDCYLVRPMATRSTGLPDAKTIKMNEGAKAQPQTESTSATKKKSTKKNTSSSKYDDNTLQLLTDLAISTVAYTKSSLSGDSLPTQNSIDEARTFLEEAQKRLLSVGSDVKKQVKDKQLVQLSSLLYSRIPKKKNVGGGPDDWILSAQNILKWQQDLDAFESALYSTEVETDTQEFDPFAGFNITLNWVSPKSTAGEFVYDWWPKASGNRHPIPPLKIKNLWEVEHQGHPDNVRQAQEKVLADKPKLKVLPKYQAKNRDDLPAEEAKRFKDTNTALLFHGTRSVNVSGILREAFRLPDKLVGVVITGAMFGPGLYYADDWRKSAGYTSMPRSFWANGGGAVQGRNAFMFAVDVVLGDSYDAPKAHGHTEPPKSYHSVIGKGGGKTGLQNNEFVVYKASQCRIRYLIEFTTGK